MDQKSDQVPYGKFTLKDLEGWLEEIYTSRVQKDRQVKLWRGCETNGISEGFNHCGNESCALCNHFAKVLDAELKRQFNEK